MITAVGIVVPARDEQRRIRRCVRGLVAALPPGVEPAVCVVADRCADRTAELAALPGLHILTNRVERTIGEVRDLGFQQVCSALAEHEPRDVLLLSTDADSVVPPDWARRHIRLIDEGADAVAGVIELAGRRRPPPGYASVVAEDRRAGGNVYGANLGVRADAYLAVGGFGAVATGEDHHLWHRLGQAGYRRSYAAESTVLTSARRHGRAPGGLADLLRSLHVGRDAPRMGSFSTWP
jgi:cellulose synthase/poly-beta-1,6-N-acetylglucosamine synthase-like glycosyltransferase